MGSQFYDLKKSTYLAVNRRTGMRYKVAAPSPEMAMHQLLRAVPLMEGQDWTMHVMCTCGNPTTGARHCSEACKTAGEDQTATNLIRRPKKAG